MSAAHDPDEERPVRPHICDGLIASIIDAAGLSRPPVPVDPEWIALRADLQSAREIARLTASRCDVNEAAVFEVIDERTPRNLQCLLASREGWVALSEYACFRLGVRAPRFTLTLH